MNLKHLDFIALKGTSFVSKTIKFYTRSDYSHIGFVMPEGKTLIEAWTHDGGVKQWWDYSTPAAHKNGTPYEIWRLTVSEDDWVKVTNIFMDWADQKLPYDWWGILGFVTKGNKESSKGKFCSEGCIEPLVDVFNLTTITPSHISPEQFVNLVEAMGAHKIKEGLITNGLLGD